MSSIRRIKAFKKLTVELKDISPESLSEMEKKLIECFKGRFSKLKTYLKDMTVYKDKKWIMVNDAYGTHKDFQEIAKAFGFLTGQVSCTIKGENFVVTDRVFGFLSVLNCQEDLFSDVEGLEPDAKLRREVNKALNNFLAEQDIIEEEKALQKAIEQVQEKGSYSVSAIEELEKKVMDRRTLSTRSNGITYDKKIKNAYDSFGNQVKNYVDNFSDWMKEGMKKMISLRAKSMGYNVQEKQENGKIKLVLIRND